MGAALSGFLSMITLGCQSIMCCCNLANCCMSASGGISSYAAKGIYICILGIATVVGLILRFSEDLSINMGAWEVHCSSSDDEQDIMPSIGGYKATTSETYVYCKGDAAVFRISFVLAVFFLVHVILSLTGKAFHKGYWGFKLMGLFVGLLLAFFIPNSFFDNSGYAWVSRIGSMFFLALQVLILIDFAYQMNDYMVDMAFRDGEENTFWLAAILGSSAVLYLVALVGIPLLFTFFGECGTGIAFSTITLIGIIIFTILTLFRDRVVGMEGAILPAGVVAAYCTYLCFSALESNPSDECKPDSFQGSDNETVNMIIGALLASLSLMWTSYSVTSSLQGLVVGTDEQGQGPNASTPLYSVEDSAGNETQVQQGSFETGEADDEPEGEYLYVFHGVLFLASMYLAMLLTNWGSSDGAHGNEHGSVSTATMYAKIVSQWLTICLYIWTLVAPRVLQDRDWDF